MLMNPDTQEASFIEEFSPRAVLNTPADSVTRAAGRTKSMHTLPPLPYAENALMPVLSPHTIAVHYGQHHKKDVDRLNGLIAATRFADMTLESIILSTVHSPEHSDLY